MTDVDTFDHLAAMFLTEDRTTVDGATRAPTVELLLVGHLPVRAGLWVTPYAAAVAVAHGAVALVRLDHERPMLQVVGRDDVPDAVHAAHRLRDAVDAVRGSVRGWMVRPPADVDLNQVLARRPARATVLTGCDQAARIKAYQIIKGVVEAARRSDHPVPALGLAIVGGAPAEAERLAEQVHAAAREQLGVTVPLVHHLAQIDADIVATPLREFGADQASTSDVLRWIAAPADAVAPLPVTPVATPRAADPVASLATPIPRTPATNPIPEARRPAPRDVAPPPLPPTPRAETQATAAPTSERGAPAAAGGPWAEPLEDAHVVKRVPFGQARIDVEPKGPAQRPEPDVAGAPATLASFARTSFGTLTPIVPRCPDHERVELAVDATGRLHLLTRDDAFRELDVVARWAHKHAELLGLACRETKIDAARPAALHLFTDTPASVADLHGGSVHLHVLAPVVVEGRTGWYAAPLST